MDWMTVDFNNLEQLLKDTNEKLDRLNMELELHDHITDGRPDKKSINLRWQIARLKDDIKTLNVFEEAWSAAMELPEDYE